MNVKSARRKVTPSLERSVVRENKHISEAIWHDAIAGKVPVLGLYSSTEKLRVGGPPLDVESE